MASLAETAAKFVDSCDLGKGWEQCSAFCHDDATFSCQAEALAGITTVEAYTGWAKDLLTPVPNGNYELKALGTDVERSIVTAVCVFTGTQTGPGPVDPPTGNSVSSNYVYALEFDGDRIRHMMKVWNDGEALGQLGWA
jgi:hypothetical protein